MTMIDNDQTSVRVTRQNLFWLVTFIVVGGFFYLVRGTLLPFGMAMAVAYFFDPLVRKLQLRGLPRWLSAMIVLLVFVTIFAGVMILVLPVLEEQVVGLINAVPGWIQDVRGRVLPQVDSYLGRFGVANKSQLSENAGSYASKVLATAGTVLGGVLTGGLAILDLLSLLLVTPVVAFYLLRDWDCVVKDVDLCLPRRHIALLRDMFREIDRTLSGFIRGQALVCAIQATYYGIALTVAGLQFGALVGVMTGILTFIPYMGAIIGLTIGLIIAVIQWHDMTHILIIFGLFALGQVMEGNVITPKLVGDRIGLHPVWIIFAVLAGGALFGFGGILLAVPVAAVIGVLIRFGVRLYLASSFYDRKAEPVA